MTSTFKFDNKPGVGGRVGGSSDLFLSEKHEDLKLRVFVTGGNNLRHEKGCNFFTWAILTVIGASTKIERWQ